MQSIGRKEYLFRISELVFPGLREGRFFCLQKGTEYYFSGLISREVKTIYRSFYDAFDFAFCIDCVFSLCDEKSETRWVRKEGSRHAYATPVLSVLERDHFDGHPDSLLPKLLARRVNVLLLDSCSWKPEQTTRLRDHFRKSGVFLIFRNELDGIFSIDKIAASPTPDGRSAVQSYPGTMISAKAGAGNLISA